MSRSEPVELTVMCMLRDGQGRLLMQQQKPSWPGLAFPGGHVTPVTQSRGESFGPPDLGKNRRRNSRIDR